MGPLTGFIVTLIALVASINLYPLIYPPIIYYLASTDLHIISTYGYIFYYGITYYGYPSVLPLLLSGNSSQFPLLFVTLMSLFRQTPPLTIMPLYPLSWAVWIGMLLTSLNMFPIGMLDGGHMARAFLSQRQSRIASFIAALAMIIISPNYLPMAILFLLLTGRGHPGALDDASPIARWKIAVWASMIIIAALTIPLLGWG